MTEDITQQPGKADVLANKEYEQAISLMEYHIGLMWQEFGVFLLAETVLLGFLGTALTQQQTTVADNRIIFIGSVFGFLLCFPWYSTFQHNYTYYLLRVFQARRHESTLGVTLLSEGQMLSLGKPISTGNVRLQLPILARLLPPRRAIPLLIVVFGIAFLTLAFIIGFRW